MSTFALKRNILLAALLLSQAAGSSIVYAAGNTGPKKTVSTSSALKGAVSTSTITMATGLHDIHLTTSHLQRVTSDMINEIERQQMVVVA